MEHAHCEFADARADREDLEVRAGQVERENAQLIVARGDIAAQVPGLL